MSYFGQTVFGGSRFLFWTLAPCAMATAFVITFFVEQWTTKGALLVAFLDVGLVLFSIALFDSSRFSWAGRVVAGQVWLIYAIYSIHELWSDPASLWSAGPRSSASARNALLGLVIIGTPCLCYATLGRFTWRADAEELSNKPVQTDRATRGG